MLRDACSATVCGSGVSWLSKLVVVLDAVRISCMGECGGGNMTETEGKVEGGIKKKKVGVRSMKGRMNSNSERESEGKRL